MERKRKSAVLKGRRDAIRDDIRQTAGPLLELAAHPQVGLDGSQLAALVGSWDGPAGDAPTHSDPKQLAQARDFLQRLLARLRELQAASPPAGDG